MGTLKGRPHKARHSGHSSDEIAQGFRRLGTPKLLEGDGEGKQRPRPKPWQENQSMPVDRAIIKEGDDPATH